MLTSVEVTWDYVRQKRGYCMTWYQKRHLYEKVSEKKHLYDIESRVWQFSLSWTVTAYVYDEGDLETENAQSVDDLLFHIEHPSCAAAWSWKWVELEVSWAVRNATKESTEESEPQMLCRGVLSYEHMRFVSYIMWNSFVSGCQPPH